MKVIRFFQRTGELKLQAENFEDLWHLMKIVNKGDVVIGKTIRRYRSEGQKGESGEKKEVTIELEVDKVELHKNANILRIMGKIIGGRPEEYIQLGSHHTIDIEPGYPYKVKKKEWTSYERARIKDAEQSAKRPILKIVVMDDKLANVATLRSFGVNFDFEIQSRTSKRDDAYEQKVKKYFADIEKAIERAKRVIVAGPGFTADSFKKFIKDRNPELYKKTSLSHTSTAERSGVYELIKGGAIKKYVKEDRLSNEFEKMDKFAAEEGKGSGLIAKGLNQVEEAISYGALGELYVLDEFVRKDPSILDKAKAKGVDITIFTSEEEPWKKLKKLGSVAGILRYRIE